MVEINCPECSREYEIEFGEDQSCPECGFNSSRCSHPIEYRESEMRNDHGEGKEIEYLYCGKCGKSLSGS